VTASALRRRTRKGRSSVAVGHPRRPGLTKLAADPHDVHVISAEQTNSSAIVSGRVIAKLIRRLTPGENPDVTLPMHLRARGFEHVPGVAGTLDVQLGREPAASAVVVHDLVVNEADLWEWSQDLLTREIERLVSDPESMPDDAVMSAVTGLLGERTAAMHLGLAGGAPGFEPEHFSLLWQRSMLQSLRASLRETQRLVRRSRSSMTAHADELAATLLEGGDELLGQFDALRTRKLDATRIRVHGDLHLGQALWTGHDIVFIDFEGEPGRPIGERSIKRSPLNDVAGIVRSIDYAGRVALATSTERGRVGETQVEALDGWRRAWTERITTSYVGCYLAMLTSTADGAALIPSDAADVHLLLDAHIVLKALYEVRYELAVRPAWVSWPLAAIAHMLHR
jgi:maltose alpha-D-glucosyltransferase/alpha-amylase